MLEAYKKAKKMLLRLKNEFPDDGSVKAGYVDNHLKSLEIVPGKKAPEFTVLSMNGDEIQLSSYCNL